MIDWGKTTWHGMQRIIERGVTEKMIEVGMKNNKLSNILNSFWDWIHLTPQAYAEFSREAKNLEEYSFPFWQRMISETINLINESPSNESDIDSILTVMSIDNETEDILDYIAQNGSDTFICRILKIGVVHLQPHARWQCAELIRRRNPINGDTLLSQLLSDPDAYVRKRAQNVLDCVVGLR